MKNRIFSLISLALILAMTWSALGSLHSVLAFTPPALQYFYVTLPEDVMLQYLDDIFGAPTSPIRSIISIAIGTTGTVVYYDQWEDGGYDTDIANPGANTYNASTNPDGTQVWGDGVLANGCVPVINNTINPCASPSDDQLVRGQTITLDNRVNVNGTSPGPYSRNAAEVFFDGKDRIAASLPVAVSRAVWPSGIGSLVADAQNILPTERWGTQYVSPVGENLNATVTNGSFEDVRFLVMAGPGGSTISVDFNADGDYLDANDRNNYAMTEGQVLSVNDATGTTTVNRAGARINVISGAPVQVTLLTGDVGSTYENRFYNLIPRTDWVNDYYSPVGTTAGASCTSDWIYNPNAAAITVNYDFPGGASPDGNFSVPANSAAEGPDETSGARYYTTGATPPVFLPISGTDCFSGGAGGGTGDIYDWGNELYPVDQLSPEILIGWAPGCTDESFEGVCLDANNTARSGSRTVVWLTPLANTTIYVDKNGSGISCPGGAGAEQTIAATALTSYQINDNPTSGTRYYVHDQFTTQAYNRDDLVPNGPYTGVDSTQNWSTNWVESGDGAGAPNAGMIWVNIATVGTQTNVLQFRDNGGTNETDVSISRGRNLNGRGYSRFSFLSQFNGTFDADDGLAVEISSNNGTSWTTLEILKAPMTFANGGSGIINQLANRVYRTSAYNNTNTLIRFRTVGNLEAGDTWSIDEVHIDDTLNGDYDMTGSYIRTCDDVLLSAAFGQNPSLSFNSDDEAMDLGMGIPPYGSQIRITKAADRSFASPGDLVTYNYTVKLIQTFSTAVNNVEVKDDRCSPATYSGGDTGNPGYLDPGETWTFTCTGRMYADTTNYAIALALYGTDRIRSNPAYDTVLLTSSLGDYVWVDEDGDGDQDAGEPGIPNARVTLTGANLDGGAVSLVTYTDANGRYVFKNVPPSNAGGYTITVDNTTLPAGLRVNPTYDENGVITAHTTTVVLGSDVEYVTADFGYNWATPSETNTPTSASTGSIGDRIWSDADGNGRQDPGEPGLYNVTVELLTAGPDGLLGTADDVVAATTTTNYAGNYIFDGLLSGVYAVRVPTTPTGYTLTGDPDQPGAACTICDNRTTTPIVLAPGDVYLNADFGYQPNASTGAPIGDTLWVDTNRNSTVDDGEPRLAGVTVSLIRDLNGNGVWDAGEPIIATDITDSSGQYSFNGVPVADGVGADDYLVWVSDTANVLAELVPTYDADGASPGSGVVTGLGISAVADLTSAGNLTQDFAYAPAGHDSNEALVGDTIWFDLNNNGVYDTGEGLEGVIVNLFQDTNANGIYEFGEPYLGRATTNENGQYFFGGLAAGAYTVDIDTATLPNYGTNLENFVDPDGGTRHRAVVTLTAGQIRLDQDFGYRATTGNRFNIGGTIWNDTNADGALTEAGRFAGVTVALYTDSNDNGVWDADDELVGTTLTDASGNYLFQNLPNDRYFVDVTDDNKVLNGAWKSTGATPGADNNSQADFYTVVLSGANNTTADFGYYRDPASLGNFVWDDTDRDNLQTSGELGIPGVTVQLTITWPGGGTTVVTTVTDANGAYRFDNLLLDEDFNGTTADGSTEPTFSVSFVPPSTYTPVTANVGGDDNVDSDGHTSVPVTVTQGAYNDTVDSGFKQIAYIGDTLWYDWDGDGIQDANEPGISGVDVFIDMNNNGIYDAGDLLDTTDANGQYSFDDLPIGTYRVIVDTADLPGGLAQTADPDATFNSEHTVAASTPGTYDDVDFGYRGTGSISNFVWNDLDGDGAQDTGEGGIGGVTVWVDLDNDGVQDPTEPSAVTDANGQYYIGGLPAGTYTVRATGASISGATPTYDLNGVGTPNVTSVTLTAGQNRDDVDWGYRFAVLSISKTSSAGGTVDPGDTIQYTIVVRNNTASPQTGIVITDPLPNGTTYVPQSTQVTGWILKTYLDDFNTQSYANTYLGSVLWSTSWSETNDDGVVTTGKVFINGSGQLQFQDLDAAYITRNADLSGSTSVVLTLDWQRLSGDESVAVQLYNGTTWTTIGFTGAGSGTINYTLAAGYRIANGGIRFTTNSGNWGGTTEKVVIDNVRFTFSPLIAMTKDDIPNGTYLDLKGAPQPNTLTVAGDGFALDPGQSMQVTFSVTVDNPVQEASIDNTASVVSTQQPTAQSASTIDRLPPSSLGDRVWLDRDNDGIQDADEPGIRNVRVTLTINYPGGNTETFVTYTDADGEYSFANLFLNENYTTAGATFTLNFATPPGATASPVGRGGDSGADSNGATTPATWLYQGQTDITYDSGFHTLRLDLGDLPDSGYRTLFSPGPAHIIFLDSDSNNQPETSGGVPAVWLGTIVDVESDGNPSDWASGDDGTASDDEDGLILPAQVTPGSTATFVVTVNASQSLVRVYFGMWIDWDNNGAFEAFYSGSGVSGSPTDVPVTVNVPATYIPGSPAYIRVRAADFALSNSDSTGTILNGEDEDYRNDWTPTAVTLASFAVIPQEDAILATWETASELDNVGFNLYRSTATDGPYTLLNATLIPPQNPGSVMGGYYEWLDTDVRPGVAYYYKLEDIDVKGVSTFHGPISTTVITAPTAVGLRNVAVRGATTPLALGLTTLLGLAAYVSRRRR